MKSRGDPSIRQTGTTSVQQESPLDPPSQPLASSSSKDAGNEEGKSSDTQPSASSLLEEGSITDNGYGQQSLAEPSAEGLTDFPSDFEISLLADFSQQADDQGGDGFDFSLSPSHYTTEVFPSTQHDPTRSEALGLGTPENLRPSPLGSRDEISWYFPTSRQPQDMPVLNINSDATSTSFHASTLASTDDSFQNRSGQPCQCLAAVVFALEKFEAGCNAGNRAELDSVVACQKEAIKCCRSMLGCRSCVAKRETLVLLVFIIEKIVVACGRVVVLYRTKDGNDRAGQVPPSWLLDHLPSSDRVSRGVDASVENLDLAISISSCTPNVDRTHSIPARKGTSSDWQELLLGDYDISSPLEWDHLVRVLISLQLRSMMELLADIKDVGSTVLGETQLIKLGQAETRVGDLEKDMQNV